MKKLTAFPPDHIGIMRKGSEDEDGTDRIDEKWKCFLESARQWQVIAIAALGGSSAMIQHKASELLAGDLTGVIWLTCTYISWIVVILNSLGVYQRRNYLLLHESQEGRDEVSELKSLQKASTIQVLASVCGAISVLSLSIWVFSNTRGGFIVGGFSMLPGLFIYILNLVGSKATWRTRIIRWTIAFKDPIKSKEDKASRPKFAEERVEGR